jgi:2-phospho-L-lactate guanylyltransferase
MLRGMIARLQSGSMDAGLLPVKRLAAAKSRLQEVFDPRQRLELASAMLDDALDLCAAVGFLEWSVVTSDPEVGGRAERRGFEVIPDPPRGGLNRSLTHAIGELGDKGADSVTIVPADAPLATADELHDLLDTGALSDVVVVPAERDAGTNGLFLSPPTVLAPRFGESSFSSYVKEAEAARLRCSILPLDGLAVDVDTIEDVTALLERADRETRAVSLLRAWTAEG